MFGELGILLRASRLKNDLEQADVARELGVRQQAVSTWERGGSRPRRTMLAAVGALLGVQEAVLVDAGHYARPSSRRVTQSSLAATTRTLPIPALAPDRLEDLTVDVLQLLHPEGHATRFGGPGHKQDGIDVLVASKDAANLATAQCKRRAQFGPAQVLAAVNAVEIEAPVNYLFLSRLEASPEARKEIGKHTGWQLWDGHDISTYLQSRVPLDRAIRIVDTYFPGHRESFLGVRAAGPWMLPEDYFTRGPSQLYNHEWTLAGRAEALAEVVASAYCPANAFVTIDGPGGIGKTRLLKAVAEACPDPDTQVLILADKAEVSPDDFELLPSAGSVTLLIDDAHDREDLPRIIAGVWARNETANIVVSTRPYRWSSMRGELRRAGLLRDDAVVVELADLDLEDGKGLAREALGDGISDAVVEQLARLTTDCPLITVVGGVLIRRGQLDPAQLDQDDEVRAVVLERFAHVLVTDPNVADQVTRTAVLKAVAALQPFRTDDASIKAAAEHVTGQSYDVLLPHLRALEGAGVFRRRGASLRIVPDLLGDILLATASIDDLSGQPTGYLDRLRAGCGGQALLHLFVNVNRVDWQIRRRRDAMSVSLVDVFWEPYLRALESADIPTRRVMINQLQTIAYFQPERITAVARWLIDNPTDEVGEATAWSLRPLTYTDVLLQIPPMLKPAAYTFEAMPAVLEILWELAQLDTREPHQHPDHARQLLTELAKFEMTKPVSYNEAFLEVASTWFSDETHLSPFDVLKPLLETEGGDQTYRAYTLSFQPFALNIDVVGPLRKRVVQLALEEVAHPQVRRAAAGVKCIGEALRYPSGMYGRPVSTEEHDRWTPVFVETIEGLGDVVARYELDPAVVVAIRECLNWHATYSESATNEQADAVLAALPDRLEDRVALILHDGWGHLIRSRELNHEAVRTLSEERLSSAVADLEAWSDAEVVATLERRLKSEEQASHTRSAHPGPLFQRLIVARPALAGLLLDPIVNDEASALRPLLPVVLSTAADNDPDATIAKARELVASGCTDIRRAVAQALGWNRSQRGLAEGELDLILEFAADPDPNVRHAAVNVAQRLLDSDVRTACQLFVAADFSDAPKLAEDLFMLFGTPFNLTWEHFDAAQQKTLRDRLVAVPDIGEYTVTEFLASRSAPNPEWVVQLLQDRIMLGADMERMNDYRPLPYSFHSTLRVREHCHFTVILQQLHAWIADGLESWVRTKIGAELFKLVSGAYDEAVLVILSDALRSTKPADAEAVAVVLREADRTFIWDHVAFVCEAFAAATATGTKARDAIASALWGCTISGSRSGTPGEPFPQDLEQRDRSNDVAAKLPAGSFEQTFYLDMAKSADRNISYEFDRDRDREGDGRVW